MEARLSVVLGGRGGGGLVCVGAGGATPGIGGGGRLFLLLCCGDEAGEAGDISSPTYELRLPLEKRGDVGRGGDAIGIGGGPRLVVMFQPEESQEVSKCSRTSRHQIPTQC